MLRRALNEAMKRCSSLASESSTTVDRRIMVKLLVTYFERGHSQEILQLMARMLDLSGGGSGGVRVRSYGSNGSWSLACMLRDMWNLLSDGSHCCAR